MTRQELITENLGVASDVANRFRRSLVEYEDLVQEATLALVKAADDYDPALGIEFGKFARIRMKYALIKIAATANERQDRGGSANLDAIADDIDDLHFDEVFDAIENLPDSDQQVIIRMYGLDGLPPHGRRALSEALGCSEKKLRKQKYQSLKTLKRLLRA